MQRLLLCLSLAILCVLGQYDQCAVYGGNGTACACPAGIDPLYCRVCYPNSSPSLRGADKIHICHGTASATNPYNKIRVSINSVAGHFDATGPGHGYRNAPDIYLGRVGQFDWAYNCECDPVDNCPEDPNKMNPGYCGCGNPDIIDPNTNQVTCPCDFVPKNSCQAGCRCYTFELVSIKATRQERHAVTFNVTNRCSTPTIYVAFGTSLDVSNTPTDFTGVLGNYQTSLTGPTVAGSDPTEQGVKFVPVAEAGGRLANGASDLFTFDVDGYTSSATFTLYGHTASIWESNAAFQRDPTCGCDCPQDCPVGYTGPTCTACGANTPGFGYWCVPTGSFSNPYELTLMTDVQISEQTTGIAPGSIDAQGYILTCTCQRETQDCLNGCSANGICNRANGVCQCDSAFTGVDCSTPVGVTSSTTAASTTTKATGKTTSATSSPATSESTPATSDSTPIDDPQDCSDLVFCNGNGRCVGGSCVCATPYFGLTCADYPQIGCVDNPSCDTCILSPGCTWCKRGALASCQNSSVCLGNPQKVCNPTTVTYTPPSCPDNCFGNGRCVDNLCVCDEGHSGINCADGLGLTIAEQAGIVAGVLAAIVIAAIVVAAILASGTGYGVYKYRQLRTRSSNPVTNNPLYTDSALRGDNPLFESREM